jgi:hypothetical protein
MLELIFDYLHARKEWRRARALRYICGTWGTAKAGLISASCFPTFGASFFCARSSIMMLRAGADCGRRTQDYKMENLVLAARLKKKYGFRDDDLEDLNKIEFAIFDDDLATNINNCSALKKLVQFLSFRGYQVEAEWVQNYVDRCPDEHAVTKTNCASYRKLMKNVRTAIRRITKVKE